MDAAGNDMADLGRSGTVLKRYRALVEGDAPPSEWAFAWRTELNRGGFEAYDFLMREVVDTGRCVGCAACVTICPTDVFDYVGEEPVDARAEACVRCVLCADVCPVLTPPDETNADVLHLREPALDDGYGRYSYECLVRTTRPEILARAQDGGLISAILLHQLEQGGINGAILGDILPDDPQVGVQRLATTAEEVLSAQGSRYTYSPNTMALREAMARGVKPIAVVGVPCQVDGVRQQQ
jgi:coenzyme F420 hydrogenase subunit beta